MYRAATATFARSHDKISKNALRSAKSTNAQNMFILVQSFTITAYFKRIPDFFFILRSTMLKLLMQLNIKIECRSV